MKKRISGIAPWQTAKTLALVYFAIGLVLAIPLGFVASLVPAPPGQPKPGVVFFICMPFLYAAAALIFVPIGCWVYNKAAGITGGIEVAVESEPAG